MPTIKDDKPAMPLQGHRLVLLVGFMGAGKTSVGKALSERLSWRFVDLDDLVVAREGRSVAEIFREAGEAGFRARESAALRDLLHDVASSGNTVAALGGGAVLQAENRAAIQASTGRVIFLDAPVQELFQRCVSQQVDRPLLKTSEAFEELYRSRRSHYDSGTTRLDTSGKSLGQVCDEVQQLLAMPEETH